MLKTVEDISTTKKRITIEIPADVIEKEIRDSLEDVRRKATLPGFRTGKAPMSLIEKKFGKKVEDDVLEKIIPKAYVDALNEADITPVTDPLMENQLDFKRSNPVSMTLLVEVLPKIGNLKYEGIEVKDIPVSVDDSEIDDVIKRLQEEKAIYEPSEGPVETDDLIIFDYTVKDDGTEMKDQIFKVGGNAFPENFSQAVAGKKKGDEVEIPVSFPADHYSEKLAGKDLTLKVLLKDMKKVVLPKLDDEFAKDIGFENTDALKKHLSEEIIRSKSNEVKKIQKAEILKKLIESHEFDMPESLVDAEAGALAAAAQGNKQHEEGGSGEAGAAALKEEKMADARRNVKASLLLDIIGRKENVSVTEDELKNALIGMSRRFNVPPEQLMKFYISRDGSLSGLKNSIYEEKVLDLILSKSAAEKGA